MDLDNEELENTKSMSDATIRFLKVFNKTNIEYCKISNTSVSDIVNYIDKLEKENEELKDSLERDIYARDCLAKHSISKDKIREKIKQLEKSPFVLYGQTIEILKELIGE